MISVLEENKYSKKGRDKMKDGAIQLRAGNIFQNNGIARQRSLDRSLPGKLV